MADFTIADVLAWARTKPAGESYNYHSNENCALCQFLCETGRAKHPTVGGYWRDWTDGPYRGEPTSRTEYPEELEMPLTAGTFGGLVAQLEALCPDAPVTKAGWAAIDAYLTDIDAVSADKLAPAHIQPHTV